MTARCPVHDCTRPIRSWRLWRRQPAQRAADVDVFFPVLGRFARHIPPAQWDPLDLAVFAAWGQWARNALHDWAHGDRDARTPLITEAALDAWCAKATLLWNALAEVEPDWCAAYAATAHSPVLSTPAPLVDFGTFDIAV